ncbi:MAG: hypothetical protein J6D03_10115 [Clostridia bacterium]|nr:hypothetical protein [Clostridia bacterium]
MLRKLLKYDLKWCYKPLLVFYILAIFFSIIVRIVENLEQNLIVLIIDKICCGIVIAMIVNIVINCFMRNWARFVRNIYKDESYLTHTLPVSKNKIYLSKILTAIITLLTSFIVIIVCLAIAILNKETWAFLKESLEQSAIYFDSSVFSLIFVMIITIFFEFLFMMMSGILGIIIGHKSNNLKIVKSIVISFLIYMILSSMSLGVLFIAGLLNSDIMSLFNNIEVSSSALKSMMLVGILVYAIYNLGIYFIGNKLLNKGIDVD